MKIDNLQQLSAYSVIGTITLLPLLVLPAMIGMLVGEAGLGEAFAFGISVAIALMLASMLSFFLSVRRTQPTIVEVQS
jgi:hypothetical protein